MFTESDPPLSESLHAHEGAPIEWQTPSSDHIYEFREVAPVLTPLVEFVDEDALDTLPASVREQVITFSDAELQWFTEAPSETREADMKRLAASRWFQRKSGYWPNPARYVEGTIGLEIIEDPVKEEFIIGQAGKGIRFLNYGDDLEPQAVEQCTRFVEYLSQYVGERLYDFVTDVVISKFPEYDPDLNFDMSRSLSGIRGAEAQTAGFTDDRVPGVIFTDAELLDIRTDPSLDGEFLLSTLIHEAGHLIHGSDVAGMQALQQFAGAIGFEQGHGSPTTYGLTSVKEAFAETARYTLLSHDPTAISPDTNDAFLALLQDRMLKPGETQNDRPIATPVNREPIVVERRVGDTILYPALPVPDHILVKSPW